MKFYYNKLYARFVLSLHAGLYCFAFYWLYRSKEYEFLTALLILTSISLVFYAYNLLGPAFQSKIAVELTLTGIVDNLHNRTILWDDIEDIYKINRTQDGTMIIIIVKDSKKYRPDTYLGYIPYFISILFHSHPITIGTNWISVTNLFDQISTYAEKEDIWK